MNELRDLRTLAASCGLSVRTLRRHIRDPLHPLPAYRVGGKLLVRQADFDRWLEFQRLPIETVIQRAREVAARLL